MSAAQAHTVGRAMETLACDYLSARGLAPVARNYRTRRGELDLVMRDGAAYVFVEVRYRSRTEFGDGAASVDRRKQQRVMAAAICFLLEKEGSSDRPCRFDVVSISNHDGAPRVKWLKNAFEQ